MERDGEKEGEDKTISKHYFELVSYLFDILRPCWAEPGIKPDQGLDTVNFPGEK